MRIAQKSFIVFFSKLVGSVFGFVATIYFARLLGAEILGYYASVLAIVAWLAFVSDLGVTTALTKRVSEGREQSSYFTGSVLLILGLGSTVCIVVLLLADTINAYVGETVAAFVVLLLVVRLFHETVIATLEGENNVHIAGLLSPLKIGSRSVVQVLLVLTGFSLSGLLIGYAVGGVLTGVVGLLVVSIHFRVPSRKHLRRLMDFAKFSWLGKLQARSFNEVDILVLTVLVPSTFVGIYSIAWSITKFLTLFGSAISSTLFPEISRADSQGNTETVSTLVSDSLLYNGLLIIPGLFGAFILARPLLRIYGPEFIEGATVLWILVLAALLYGYQEQFMYALNAIDYPNIAFRVNLVFIGLNVLLNIALVLQMGFVGAAIATAISAGTGLVLSFFAFRSKASFEIPISEISKQFFSAATMAVIIYSAREFSKGLTLDFDMIPYVTGNTVILVALVSAGAFIYFTVLLSLSSRFRETLLANAPLGG